MLDIEKLREEYRVFRRVDINGLSIYIKSTEDEFQEIIENNLKIIAKRFMCFGQLYENEKNDIEIELDVIYHDQPTIDFSFNTKRKGILTMSRFISITDWRKKDCCQYVIEDLRTFDKGIYRDCNGGYYEVLNIAKKSDIDDKYFVVYKALFGTRETYIKLLDEFIAEVEPGRNSNSKQKYRFERIKFEMADKEMQIYGERSKNRNEEWERRKDNI